jgi:hypothetical protein
MPTSCRNAQVHLGPAEHVGGYGDTTRIEFLQPIEAAQDGAFAGTAPADQHDHAAAFDVERHVVQYLQWPVTLRDVETWTIDRDSPLELATDHGQGKAQQEVQDSRRTEDGDGVINTLLINCATRVISVGAMMGASHVS